MGSAAGIRELKDNLSEYVRRAEAGEQIDVTSHGRVLAVLGPPEKTVRGRCRTRLEQMIADGTARPPLEDGHLPDDWAATGIHLPTGTAAALIDAGRDEE